MRRSHLFFHPALRLLSVLCVWLFVSPTQAQYAPDILGTPYVQHTFPMGDDEEGEVVSTLVKRLGNEDSPRAVLYVHGYNDYFFQQALGDSIAHWGYRFYALDLRKYGRSLRPHQDAFSCHSLEDYFADLDSALAVMRVEGAEELLLMGHSTGGLITAYYLQTRQKEARVSGLILNSPFLDWNFSWWMEEVLLPVVSFLGKYWPNWIVSGEPGNPNYAFSLLQAYKGEWTFRTDWKMPYGHAKRAGWIRAIQEAQQSLQKGKQLPCPVLLLSSNRSLPEGIAWDEAYRTADIVLDVNDIRDYGQRLSPHTTYHSIPDGLHDLVLSKPAARKQTYAIMRDWLERQGSRTPFQSTK